MLYVSVRTENTFNGVQIDWTAEETIELCSFSGNNGNEFLYIHSVVTQDREDVSTERNSAADDVFSSRMMINSEFLLEYGLNGMGQRGMADVVQKCCRTRDAAFR